jgi:hypothetical protein
VADVTEDEEQQPEDGEDPADGGDDPDAEEDPTMIRMMPRISILDSLVDRSVLLRPGRPAG